ncbi:MAG: DNA primase [Sphingomonadaceae bacterium]|uniref:DNA primase n=1 Tax=Thermaurantiacus sp. TaxID=2820283 RepID=UPI00298F3AA7|nr:DNA primase [Thermaurantiacus sp.]MCS6986774.1 DNA primase [Sphingomonadaceae bacterium]MDW8413963.1 DNA primase [Thermaurantiacus sp.]
MSFAPAFLDELKARVSLPEVVGRRIRLVRAGRDLKGCCPFHQEKTPSFHVWADHYHCFGCGAHGDVIRFVMETERLDFASAVRRLAAEAGLKVPERAGPTADERLTTARALLAAAARWFAERLAAPEGDGARAYLARRGVEPELARTFGLGWAPPTGLSDALTRRVPEAGPDAWAAAGLLGDDGRPRFRRRIVFPIHDGRGRVVGFGGRLIGPGEPKYLNSPDGPLFHKGRLLFNAHRAAPAARRTGRLWIVEGYMDVVGLARAGVSEAVAPLGTALTDEQLELAWQLAAEPLLAFDGDTAGRRAARAAAQRALPLLRPGRSLAFALLPPGEDPDDVAARGGRAALDELARNALPLERLLFDAEVAESPLDTPERRAGLRARLDALAAQVADPGIAADYRRTWRERAWRLLGPPPAGRAPRPPAAAVGPLPETRAAARRPVSTLPGLLRALADRPQLAAEFHEHLAALEIDDPRLAAVRDALLAGRPDALAALGTETPLVPPDASAEEFRDRVRAALASYALRAHVARRGESASDGRSLDEAWERHVRWARRWIAGQEGLRARAIPEDGA